VLTDTINRLTASGMDRFDAVVTGATRRLRPILLTSITTVCGLAPLMLETSFQAQFLIPLAISLVFGLMVGTFLVPVLVPCLYMILGDLTKVVSRVSFQKPEQT
jgi:multidrug efflux pump subunit AcrB